MYHLFDWKDFYSWNWRQVWSRKWLRSLSLIFYWLTLQKNMETYCIKRGTKAKNLNSIILKIISNRLIMQSMCSECRIKNSTFMKEQEAKELLNNLGIKTLLSKIPLLGNILF